MSTEFERLLRLAEQNTLDLQRASLERKRQIGDRSATDGTSEREMQEKRRKLELEKRIKQREDDEKQRLAQTRADVERRRRERLLAEEAERKQRQPARGPAGKGSSTNAKDSATRKILPKEDQEVSPKRLSYEELMRIASGQAEPPARRPVKPLLSQSQQQQQQQQRTKVGTARAAQGRQQPEQRSLKAEAPKPRIESSVPRRQQPVGSAGIRQLAKPLPSKGRDSPALSPASKVATTAGRSVEPRERHRVPQAPRRAAGSEAAPKQKESLEPRMRKAPERELDRFGVHVAGSAKRDPVNRTTVRSEPPQRARMETMPPRSNGRREEQADRRPRPRSPVSSQSQRVASRDRSAPASTRSGMASNIGSSNRQRDRSPRRRLSPPPAARRCNAVARRPVHKRRGDYDDESEYDSLDDFIVDDDEEGGSAYCAGTVREIMGVRYRDVNDDDDDDDMEVSTRQLMLEERRSARLGRQEDEEEERRLEEEERARARRRREKYD